MDYLSLLIVILILGIVPFVLGLGGIAYSLWLTMIISKGKFVASFVDIVIIVASAVIGTLSWSFGLGIISRVLSYI